MSADRCSFCRKTKDQVRKLISGPGVMICDGCVEFCVAILDKEVPDWRTEGQEPAARPQGPPTRPAGDGLLTARELMVMRLLAQGESSQEVAQNLAMSLHTVRTHIRNVLIKVGAQSKLEAIARLRNLGLLD